MIHEKDMENFRKWLKELSVADLFVLIEEIYSDIKRRGSDIKENFAQILFKLQNLKK